MGFVDGRIVNEALAIDAAQTAMHAAVAYLHFHKQTADAGALAECLRSHCRAALPAALHDARKALDAHMDSIAIATFRATFAQAGIEAAKEAGF